MAIPGLMDTTRPNIMAQKVIIFLASGSSWTVPDNWNNHSPGSEGFANRIECIGAGGGGGSGAYGGGPNSMPGGQGGTYGGGGGGTGDTASSGGTPGYGGDGIIVISYYPTFI